MSETYCGKDCSECTCREELSCPGCKEGPGRRWSETCEIAGCCSGRVLSSCADCQNNSLCGTLRLKRTVAVERLQKQQAEARRESLLKERAPILGKWLWILFWLIVPELIAAFMTPDVVQQLYPNVYRAGLVLGFLCDAAYAVILILLASVCLNYRKAGVYSGIGTVGSLLMDTVVLQLYGGSVPLWSLLVNIPLAAVGIYGYYCECMAHAEVLRDADFSLSEKWTGLWKLYAAGLCVLLGALLVLVVFPGLGALAMLAASGMLLVAGIMKLVYLYRSADLFRSTTFR